MSFLLTYSGKPLSESVLGLLRALIGHGFECETSPGGKTIRVLKDGVASGYVKSYVLASHGALGYRLSALGVKANYCPVSQAPELLNRFCERHCCTQSDVIVYKLSGNNKGRALFIIKDPHLALDVLLRDAGLPRFIDQFELYEPLITEAEQKTVSGNVYTRSRQVRMCARHRAAGFCEYCGEQGFEMANGDIYLETHHIAPLSEGGEDSEINVAALCPNDHRKAHFAKDRETIAEKLRAKIGAKSVTERQSRK